MQKLSNNDVWRLGTQEYATINKLYVLSIDNTTIGYDLHTNKIHIPYNEDFSEIPLSRAL